MCTVITLSSQSGVNTSIALKKRKYTQFDCQHIMCCTNITCARSAHNVHNQQLAHYVHNQQSAHQLHKPADIDQYGEANDCK